MVHLAHCRMPTRLTFDFHVHGPWWLVAMP